MGISALIKAKASEIGFDACGIARAGRLDADAVRLREWLDNGFNAGLGYMDGYFDKRTDPRLLVEGARSVIVCLISYNRGRVVEGINPEIASYAMSADYHYTVKQKLGELLKYVEGLIPDSCGRVFTDSAPVFERAWAVKAGLGWIGRSSMLINPGLGSFTIIGTVITDAEMDEYAAPYEENHCGDCGRCVAGCPTGAIRADKTIDAGKCISYHTIENRGDIPPEIAAKLDRRMFGCDVCQKVCPHNACAPATEHEIFMPVDGIAEMTAGDWLSIGSGEFRRRFGNTPLSRCGLRKIKSTVMILKEQGLIR